MVVLVHSNCNIVISDPIHASISEITLLHSYSTSEIDVSWVNTATILHAQWAVARCYLMCHLLP